jgi:fatty acid desaturase
MHPPTSPGVTALAREAALGLGHLVGQHVKVAQLELKVELHAMGRRASMIAVLLTLIALGYGLAMAGLAVVIGGHTNVGLPLVVIGLAHVAGAGVGLLFSPLRPHGSHLMDNSTAAMNSSLAALDKATAPSEDKPTTEPARAH